MSYEDRMEYARDAEGEDNTDPSAPDAPGCFPRTPLDDAIAAGEGPIGPIYTLTDEERF